MKNILVVTSHPDDESFLIGGTIAQYAKNGWHIDLICITDGDQGSTGTLDVEKGPSLGVVRQEELKKAGEILGIKNIIFFHQKDGKLSELTPGTLEDMIHEKMMACMPDIVITFNTTGVSNHPDHVKTCYATTYAFQKYASYLDHLKNPEIFVRGRGKIWKHDQVKRAFGDVAKESVEPKLYYACIPKNDMIYLQKNKLMPEESWGKPLVGTEDKMVTSVIDITEEQLLKGKALLAHVSQYEDVDRYISFANNPLVDREYFVLRMQGICEVYMGKTDEVSNTL